MEKYAFYPEIENLYGKTENDPIKVFLVASEYAYTALAKAILDVDVKREGVLNTLDGPNSDGFFIKQPGIEFANDVVGGRPSKGSLGLSVILDHGVNIDGHQIVLIDIVTYPVFHCLLTGLDLFCKGNEGVLWKVNHNILAPFIGVIKKCGAPVTFIHLNEDPLDDAPTHNLIAFTQNPFRQVDISQAVYELAISMPNVNIVSKSSPIMDDRYCLNKRLPKDPPCSILPELNRDIFLLPKD